MICPHGQKLAKTVFIPNLVCSSEVLLEAEGKYDEAESLYRRALQIQQKALGEGTLTSRTT